MFNKEINKAYLSALIAIGVAFISILIMAIIFHDPANHDDIKVDNDIKMVTGPSRDLIVSVPKLDIPNINVATLNQKAYSEAYLFKHEDFAQALNNYCANNTVATSLARDNCDKAFEVANPLNFAYLLLSNLLTKPKFWGAFAFLVGFILLKKLFTMVYTLSEPARYANSIKSYHGSSEK